MTALDAFLRSELASFEPEIREMADYCIDTSGKRIRPSLVFLSGGRGWDDISPDLVRVAAVVELVHLATLVHDDIMDGAELRRNRRTASKEYGAAAAVLLGDALFAHALNLAARFPTTEVCERVSESTRKVCTGEIIQTLRRRTPDVTLADYFRVIDLKTAELFRVSCQLGSKLSGAAPAYVEACAIYGRQLGIAYQIYDDLVDFFGDEKRIGKTLGTDLMSGKFTLPLFILRDRLPPTAAAELTAELLGQRAPDLALRLRQMRELDVFTEVITAIEHELSSGERALAPYAGQTATQNLLQLSSVLRHQIAAIRPAA
jgi:octaprenyl-diphosphate synthase